MKFIWEENDIEPGRRINNSSGNGEMILGYRYDDTAQRQPAIFTVVSLDDGLEVFSATLKVTDNGEKDRGEAVFKTARTQVAEWLNESKATPKTIGPR